MQQVNEVANKHISVAFILHTHTHTHTLTNSCHHHAPCSKKPANNLGCRTTITLFRSSHCPNRSVKSIVGRDNPDGKVYLEGILPFTKINKKLDNRRIRSISQVRVIWIIPCLNGMLSQVERRVKQTLSTWAVFVVWGNGLLHFHNLDLAATLFV